MPRPRLCALFALIVGFLLTPAAASASHWFLSLEGGAGFSNQTIESPLGSIDFDRITVYRGGVGVGLRHSDRLCTQAMLSWAQRGAEETYRTVYRPPGDAAIWRFERSYLDLALYTAGRLSWHRAFVSLAIGPRLSILVDESSDIELFHDDMREVLFGLDPVLSLGYRVLYASARYCWDLIRPYEHPDAPSEIYLKDDVYFVSIGVQIPL